MAPLEALQFDNTVLNELPVDESGVNETRQVRGAIYALVNPTPLAEPKLVAVSQDVLQLLGLDAAEADRPEFSEVMCGNKVLADQGSRPAAHCYAGFQFGFFAGQLGDGAAIYLGEVVAPSSSSSSSSSSPRHELQLKGSGLTPFSRQADGRKVLRSSMREFLASEAMDALGIPSTRAGSLVVSGEDQVLRDITYSGNPAMEPCAVISRIAPTFIRFGSFEVCRPPDSNTGRSGPSAGLTASLLPPLVGYVIKHHYPDIWGYYSGGDDISMSQLSDSQARDLVESWFAEVCRRTAHLVAAWQSVGFVHGVLNTDNMSITGHTLDYGPYGFMDRFDSRHVSNGSDDGARYTYEAQPGICRWNCERLAEALSSIPAPSAATAAATDASAAAVGVGAEGVGPSKSLLPGAAASKGLAVYDDEFARTYRAIMRRKLGLLGKAAAHASAEAAVGSSAPSSSSAGAPAGSHAAAGLGPASKRPIWPLAADASAEVCAAAAAVSQAGSSGLDESDDRLIADLLTLMEETGADFTNTFRRLALVPMPQPSSSNSSNTPNGSSTAAAAAAAAPAGPQNATEPNRAADAAGGVPQAGGGDTHSSSSQGADVADAASVADAGGDYGGFLSRQLSELASPSEMAAGNKPSMPLENVQMLLMVAGRDAGMLHALGINPNTLTTQLARHKAAATWATTTPAAKAERDASRWSSWLKRYRDRLQREADDGVRPELRVAVMAASNPRVVLRNWIAQTAIRAAELGHFSTVRDILQLLRQPYKQDREAALEVPPAAAIAAAAAASPAGAADGQQDVGGSSGGSCPRAVKLQFDGKPPAWAARLCVTCSS